MAKRNTSSNTGGQTTDGTARTTAGADAVDDRLIALAEQFGRIVGTMQAKAGAWLDRDALMQQLAQIRDDATQLLEQLGVAGGAAPNDGAGESGEQQNASRQDSGRKETSRARRPNSTRAAAGGRQKTTAEATEGTGRQNNQPTPRGRSGGVVDAPGKKHRKPAPNEVRATAAETGRLAKMKIVNANRRRGR